MEFLLPLHLQDAAPVIPIPAAHRQLIMPFARAEYREFPGGSFLSQEIKGTDYTIWQHHFFITTPSLLYPYSNHPLLTINYMLEGSVDCQLHGFGLVKLQQGKHHLFYVPPQVKNEAMFDTGAYLFFHIDFSIAFLEKVAVRHPFLKPFIEKANRFSATGDQQYPSPITRKENMLIEEIIQCRDTNGEVQLFIEARVRDLLLIYVKDQTEKTELALSNPKQSRIALMISAFIEEHLDQKLSVDLICRQAMISKSALQLIFQKQYGKSIHQAILDMRMKKSMELLVSTDLPIGEIVSIVSDKSFSYFSSSFTKYYGHAPGYYRKKQL
ncbi:MAG: AraC family transcriptional regulator [Flavitalea sp.]